MPCSLLTDFGLIDLIDLIDLNCPARVPASQHAAMHTAMRQVVDSNPRKHTRSTGKQMIHRPHLLIYSLMH